MKKRICGTVIVIAMFVCVIFGNTYQKQTKVEQKERSEGSEQVVEIENEITATTNEVKELDITKENNKADAKKSDLKKQIPETVTDGKLDETDFSVKINEVVISLGDDFSKLIKELPQADKIDEAKTCIGSGLDKVYTYDDVVIYTNVDNKNSVVYSIELGETAKTIGEIGVGAELKDIEKAYGKDYDVEAGVYTYSLNQMELNFYLTNGKVSSIDYYLYIE